MSSSGKPKTTWAKLQREAGLRERRLAKAERKQIRKQGMPDPGPAHEFDAEAPETAADEPAPEPEPLASV